MPGLLAIFAAQLMSKEVPGEASLEGQDSLRPSNLFFWLKTYVAQFTVCSYGNSKSIIINAVKHRSM